MVIVAVREVSPGIGLDRDVREVDSDDATVFSEEEQETWRVRASPKKT